MKIAASGNLTGRAVQEWIGSSPDAKIPEEVQLRIYLRFNGKDAVTGERLIPGGFHFDHIIPLWKGGEHRESNLQPLAHKQHKEKTKAEARERAKIKRLQKKHLLPKPKSKWPSRPMGQRFTTKVKQLDEAYDD